MSWLGLELAAGSANLITGLILSLYLITVVSAQNGSTPSGQPKATGNPAEATRRRWAGEKYRIGPRDLLEIRVFNRPQLSRDSVRVSEDGEISLPLIGTVSAACRTEEELAGEIASRYLKYLKNPEVDVFVKDYQSRQVAVIGAVKSPGRFQLTRSVKLLELLSFVGGPNERAGRTLQIFHDPSLAQKCGGEASDVSQMASSPDEDSNNLEFYNLRETMKGNQAANPYMRPGDIVTLLDADQVYIVGNVLRPSAIPLIEPITISRAIAMAGGTMPDTKSNRVRIVRRQANGGGKTEIFVDLKAIDNRQAEDIELQANDIVDVPTSGGKRFLRSLVSVIAPSVASLPVRVIP